MRRMRILSLFAGIGGFDLGLERAGMKVVGAVEIDRFRRAVLKTHWPLTPLWDDVQTLTFSSVGSRVKTSRSLVRARDLLVRGADSSLRLFAWQKHSGLVGSSSKTSLVSLLRTKVPTSCSSSKRYPNAGMAWRGEFWTASISECPKHAVESTLSDILEAHVPPRFYLTAKGAIGILRRAVAHKATIPPALQAVLERVASTETPDTMVSTSAVQMGSAPRSKKEEPEEAELSIAHTSWVVRRLTPTECERLQGFPDGWTQPDTALWGTPIPSPSSNGSDGE